MKPLRSHHFGKASRGPKDPGQEDLLWEPGLHGRYKRSYEALGDALKILFEHAFILTSLARRNPGTGENEITKKSVSVYESIKNRFALVMQDDRETGLLELEIAPVNESGMIQNYADAPAALRKAITNFYTDMNKITAGIAGVEVSLTRHNIIISGPEAFFEMIKDLCAAKKVSTAETVHDTYIESKRPAEEDRGGYHPYADHMAVRLPVLNRDLKTGTNYRRKKGEGTDSRNPPPEIPEPVFQTMSPHAYGDEEIGYLLNRQTLYPLLSLQNLQATIRQDLQGTTTLKESPAFNLH